MTLLISIILFIVGLAAIIKGADWLTDGAAAIAERFGIPTIVVGLTIVAIGSSAPEFVVSVISAVQGNVDIALGNVVGSNIFNILAIMGVTAMVRPIRVDRANIRYDVPFVVLASIAIAAPALLPCSCGKAEVDRADGILMLCLFAVFMGYTISIAKKEDSSHKAATNTDNANATTDDALATTINSGLLKCITLIIVGLACLILGGDWLVGGASGIASVMGISQSIIALTVVSIGTSAPELAASVMAARKGDTAMALGNVVGSVVFNVFFVLGTASVIQPLGIGGITVIDIAVLCVASVLLWIFCKFGKTYYTLTRSEGAIMLLLMIAYYAYLIITE